jgi:hypothetical protein
LISKNLSDSRGSFLRSDTKCWISSSLFFMCIEKLGLNEKIYYIPSGIECTNEELVFYVDHLFDELGHLEMRKNYWTEAEKDARNYVTKIGFALRNWSKEGFGVKLI